MSHLQTPVPPAVMQSHVSYNAIRINLHNPFILLKLDHCAFCKSPLSFHLPSSRLLILLDTQLTLPNYTFQLYLYITQIFIPKTSDGIAFCNVDKKRCKKNFSPLSFFLHGPPFFPQMSDAEDYSDCSDQEEQQQQQQRGGKGGKRGGRGGKAGRGGKGKGKGAQRQEKEVVGAKGGLASILTTTAQETGESYRSCTGTLISEKISQDIKIAGVTLRAWSQELVTETYLEFTKGRRYGLLGAVCFFIYSHRRCCCIFFNFIFFLPYICFFISCITSYLPPSPHFVVSPGPIQHDSIFSILAT